MQSILGIEYIFRKQQSPPALCAYLMYPATKMATIANETLGLTVGSPTFESGPGDRRRDEGKAQEVGYCLTND